MLSHLIFPLSSLWPFFKKTVMTCFVCQVCKVWWMGLATTSAPSPKYFLFRVSSPTTPSSSAMHTPRSRTATQKLTKWTSTGSLMCGSKIFEEFYFEKIFLVFGLYISTLKQRGAQDVHQNYVSGLSLLFYICISVIRKTEETFLLGCPLTGKHWGSGWETTKTANKTTCDAIDRPTFFKKKRKYKQAILSALSHRALGELWYIARRTQDATLTFDSVFVYVWVFTQRLICNESGSVEKVMVQQKTWVLKMDKFFWTKMNLQQLIGIRA